VKVAGLPENLHEGVSVGETAHSRQRIETEQLLGESSIEHPDNDIVKAGKGKKNKKMM